MEIEFVCTDCKKQYTAVAEKKEYVDPVYGPCTIFISVCPFCGGEGREYSPDMSGSCDTEDTGFSCPSGGCCSGCGNN